jgi:hypothetical protein
MLELKDHQQIQNSSGAFGFDERQIRSIRAFTKSWNPALILSKPEKR